MSEDTEKTQNNTKGIVIALLAIVIVAIGAGVYVSKDKAATAPAVKAEEMAQADADMASSEDTQSAEEPQPEPFEIKDGNPVVAKIGDKDVTRVEVLEFIRANMPNMTQVSPEMFPVATMQVVNSEIIKEKAAKADLSNDPLVKEQLEKAKEQIVRSVFIQKKIAEQITPEAIKATYEVYKADFPEIKEVKARHILVEDEQTAKDVIKMLDDGAEFAVLAKEYSIDNTKENGGELSFFSEKDVVPEFATAAFSQEIGEVSKEPVKSQFGYHIIEVQETRLRPAPTLEEATPFLSAQLQKGALEAILKQWRQAENVEIFDINGDALEPAAGEEESTSEPATGEEEKAAE